MDCTRFLVRPGSHRDWLIDCGTCEMGPYHSCDMALRIAISEALSVRRAGRPAHIEVEDAAGTTVAKRCLCVDFGR